MVRGPMVVEQVPGAGIRRAGERPPEVDGVRVEYSSSSFELARAYPGGRPVYYRVDHGRLEWGLDLDGFLPSEGRPALPPGTLLSLLQGNAPAPDSTSVPGLQRLAVGTVVRVTGDGISVSRRRPVLPEAPLGGGRALAGAVADALTVARGDDPGYAIAYSGGLGSAFLAACALSAGHRPLLLHADLGPGVLGAPAPEVPGLTLRRLRLDPSDLLDEHPVTGAEGFPPMPDREVPRRLAAALAGAADGTAPPVGGTLLKDLTSAKLSDVDKGVRGWRLLGCEPFHIAGTLPSLADARALLGKGVVHSPGARPAAEGAPASPTGGSLVPGLTPEGGEIFESAHRASMAVWQELLDFLDPVLGHAAAGADERGADERGADERGGAGLRLPALDARVLAAVTALGPSGLGRVRRGALRRNLPLHRELHRHGITGVRAAAPGFWLRRAAAVHLHRERSKIISRLKRECALADLGLIAPSAVIRMLTDGRDLADNALPLLRLVWLERWLTQGGNA